MYNIFLLVLTASVCRAVLARPDAPVGYLKAGFGCSDVYYTRQDAGYVPTIERMTDLYYPLLREDFGVAEDVRAKLVICRDAPAFPGGPDKSGGTPIGACRGGTVYIVSPSLWLQNADDAKAKDVFMSKGPLVHELAHFLTGVKSGGKCAAWVAEGVALYYEYKYTGSEWRPDLAGRTGVSLAELEDGFGGLDAGAAYRKAFEVILAIVEAHGEAALQRAIGR
ncbi:MAG: hypothetical protein FWC55_08945 [Firmicutes bacterium]|nr:hypothetical protein [Bacillota bacterium]